MIDDLIVWLLIPGSGALSIWAIWSKSREWKRKHEMWKSERDREIYMRGVRQGWADAERYAEEKKKRELEQERIASMTPEEIIEELTNEAMSHTRPIGNTASSDLTTHKKPTK